MPFCTASHSACERSGPSPISSSFDGIFLRTRSKISITSVSRFTGRKFDRCTRMRSPLGGVFFAPLAQHPCIAHVHIAIHKVVDHFDVILNVEFLAACVSRRYCEIAVTPSLCSMEKRVIGR